MQGGNRDLSIAYSLLPFLTPARTRLLREHFEPLQSASCASVAFLRALLSLTPEQAELVKNPLNLEMRERVAALRDSVLTLDDGGYPPLLREICDPPLALHYRGRPDLLLQPAVAIVGSRRASPYGINVASRLARELAGAGAAIVSGLARGIDAAAHEAALDAGGATIAVLGTGIDVYYPRSNARLAKRVEGEGIVVSEFAPGTPPLPENFPIRNRVIAGLSLGTVIVEATSRSGSLITARMAAEQGREVFAVPGSIFSAGTEGTHRLIQYGAKLVHDADDVLEELPGNLKVTREESREPEGLLREVLAQLRADEPSHVDELTARLTRGPGEVAESLLQLELGGWVRALPGARYVRTR
jgi:DNA processing protein